ncbi:MAG: leucine-rich repeat domain-containing protein [Erysipelotrichia bacterium]|nr:leucine-rich repeat domain-containing protein [Erysipelotrichia bacterium]
MDATKFKNIFSKDIYQLPICWDGEDFYVTLYKHLKKYREDIENNCSDVDLCNEVKKICHGICATLDFSFRGYTGKSYNSFKGVMKILKKDQLIIDKKDIGKDILYRVVEINNKEISRKRVFHVPFNMRGKMSTQRYSIPGFPSLYLGTSVDLCVKELDKDPKNDSLYVAKFKLDTDERISPFDEGFGSEIDCPVFDNSEFIIFDVSIKPDKAINEMTQSITEMKKYIKWYPLISTCSYIRYEKDSKYSAEYIIPQLFIQWVRLKYDDAIVGIKYFSCASLDSSTLGYNYVFPTMGVPYMARKTITEYCARLSHRFKLTFPRCIKEYESIPDCVKEMEKDNCFDYIEGYNAGINIEIEDYAIPEGLSIINAFTFFKCESLNNVTIPESVISIGNSSFSWCTSLCKIYIPENVTSIGDFAFYGCEALVSASIPSSITSIGDSAFSGNKSLEKIEVDNSNIKYTSDDGILYNKKKTKLICYPAGKKQVKFEIPSSVVSVAKYAFEGCNSLETILVSGSMKCVSKSAFTCCGSLKNVYIPDSITKIDDFAFAYCNSLTNIKIPNSIKHIGGSVFAHCISLKNVDIPEGVTSIGDSAFYGCEALVSASIPSSITKIGGSSFAYCNSLTSIKISKNIISIEKDVFKQCCSLKTIYYSGTEKEAEKIIIAEGNEYLNNATWVYDFSSN